MYLELYPNATLHTTSKQVLRTQCIGIGILNMLDL